ncbi:hypothetical protein KIW84_033202 [Lathyrus oleraceus]|uniref:Uncharacterized protein n=1 Tax=Pisum sativum TaxID=3888 RepID=A0A9D5B2V1_PEA|nr:hypothetical protein KIW84_033202 [Pisum sativum]
MRKGQCLTAVETFRREPLNSFRGPKISISIFRNLLLPREKRLRFFVGIEYENLPLFCYVYKAVGHSLDSCIKSSNGPLNFDIGNKKKPSQIYVRLRVTMLCMVQFLFQQQQG